MPAPIPPAPPPCTLHRISEHVWWFTPESRRDRPSLAAVVGTRETALLDVGASPAHTRECLAAMEAAGLRAPTRAVLTHWHWDHVFGLEAFAGPVLAQRGTAAMLERMAGWDYSDAGLPGLMADGREIAFTCEHLRLELGDAQRRALRLRRPEQVFDAAAQLDLGGVECVIRHVGGDHAADSSVIHVPQDGVLFMGDCFYDNIYAATRHYTRERVLPLIDRLEGFAADLYIQGHGGEPTGRACMLGWFRLIREAYAALDRFAGVGDGAAGGGGGAPVWAEVEVELRRGHGAGDVDDFLPLLRAGCEISARTVARE